jgi:sulfur relay (sulfurtransferase) complex TusBCD TusD component (DsrE family)
MSATTSAAFMYENMAVLYTLPGVSKEAMLRHLNNQRATEDDFADMQKRLHQLCHDSRLEFCASCGEHEIVDHTSASQRVPLIDLVTPSKIYSALLYSELPKVEIRTDDNGSMGRWDSGVVHFPITLLPMAEWDHAAQLSHFEDTVPIALYKELVQKNEQGDLTVSLCSSCNASLRRGRVPEYNVQRWHMARPPCFVGLSGLEKLVICPFVSFNTMLTGNNRADKSFTGHILSLRKDAPTFSKIPCTAVSEWFAITLVHLFLPAFTLYPTRPTLT